MFPETYTIVPTAKLAKPSHPSILPSAINLTSPTPFHSPPPISLSILSLVHLISYGLDYHQTSSTIVWTHIHCSAYFPRVAFLALLRVYVHDPQSLPGPNMSRNTCFSPQRGSLARTQQISKKNLLTHFSPSKLSLSCLSQTSSRVH